jgi:hypothetical protein
MGHLEGGHERDVRIEGPMEREAFCLILLLIDQGPKQDSITTVACFHPHILVSVY